VSDNDKDLIRPSRLLFELQTINSLNQSLSGCLEPQAIAKQITDGLVTNSKSAFARIWLVKEDRTELKLIASSGLYTRLDGDFKTVPMGAYKVGKIAQYAIPFLSNSLAEESWVKDREWAIANKICGFAGLPLAIAGQAIGVLAIFSHQPMEPEFLEALRVLCNSVAVALKNAQLYEQKLQKRSPVDLAIDKPLSEQISEVLTNVGLILLGTERTVAVSTNYLLLKTAEVLKNRNCNYCRLSYSDDFLSLEAMLLSDKKIVTIFSDLKVVVSAMGGSLEIDNSQEKITQLKLSIPYENEPITRSFLSGREQEVIQLLANGLRDREIAAKLFISDRTVKFHINNVVTKLQAKTRIQAIHQAYSQKLITSS